MYTHPHTAYKALILHGEQYDSSSYDFRYCKTLCTHKYVYIRIVLVQICVRVLYLLVPINLSAVPRAVAQLAKATVNFSS